MTNIEEALSLAEKLLEAIPVETQQPTEPVNLSSSYLNTITTDDKSNAFLKSWTIENHISNATSASNNSKQKAEALGLEISDYDPLAEEKAKIAAENAKKEAEEKARKEAEDKARVIEREKQKERIAQFLKWQSEKDRKLWYSRWVLAWIGLCLCLMIIWFLTAKNQIIWFLNKDLNKSIQNWYVVAMQTLSEKVKLTNNEKINKIVNLEKMLAFGDALSSNYTNSLMKNISPIFWTNAMSLNANSLDIYTTSQSNDTPVINNIEDIENIEDTENIVDENTDEIMEENLEEGIEENEKDIVDETFEENVIENAEDFIEESVVEIVEESIEEALEKNTEIEYSENTELEFLNNLTEETQPEVITIEVKLPDLTNYQPSYIANYVNDVKDANRVMAPNCSELSCGDFTKIDTENPNLCTDFRQDTNLNDNARRIGNSGHCRYKDTSELIYLSLE